MNMLVWCDQYESVSPFDELPGYYLQRRCKVTVAADSEILLADMHSDVLRSENVVTQRDVSFEVVHYMNMASEACFSQCSTALARDGKVYRDTRWWTATTCLCH